LNGFPRHKRVLLLGPTGADKAQAMSRLNEHLKPQGHSFNFVDFENEFLKHEPGARSWMRFLAQDMALQTATWRHAWTRFKNTLRKRRDEPIILALHAVYVSSVLGLRCPVHIPSVCKDFQPTLIISLVDDVYECG
jgi:hypothetical protein